MPKPKSRKKPKARATPTTCPCGSSLGFASCCGPLLDGIAVAQTPVQLMRSRYTAFCVGRGAYLWNTLHSQHEARLGGDEASYVRGAESSASRNAYRGLRILDSRDAGPDGIAQVLFHVRAQVGKLDRSIVELSSFVQEDGQWRYIAGTTRPARELAHAPEELSIDHWDCHGH